MQKYYNSSQVKPLTANQIYQIEQDISFELPDSYREFLIEYGYGSINEFLMIGEYDKDYFMSNFKDCLDFWTLSAAEEKSICKGIVVASSIDGDIFLMVSSSELPFIMVPRHSEKLIHFESFDNLLNHVTDSLGSCEKIYFDSYHNYEIENFSLIKKDKLDKKLIEEIHKLFINQFDFDKVIGTEQPIYFIKSIGGWLYFDLIYKSSIRIKYQNQYRKEAKKIINFIYKIIK